MEKLILIIAIFLLTTAIQAQEINSDEKNSPDNKQYLVKPNGEYSVSYHDFFWVNGDKKTDLSNNKMYYSCPNNPDPFYNGKNSADFNPNNQTDFCREVVVRIYYPTNKNNEMGEYYKPLTQANIDAINSLPDAQYPSDTKKILIKELSSIKSFTVANKNIIKNKTFPVLFFSPGLGGNAELYENFITHLVSHGYIVVGVNSLFISGNVSLENGHIVQSNSKAASTPDKWIQTRGILLKDSEFVYNKIKNSVSSNNFDNGERQIFSSINLKKMGIFGHSIGGSFAGDTVLAHPFWFQAAATIELGTDVLSNRPTKDVYPIPVLHQAASLTRYVCSHTPNQCFNDPDSFNLNSNSFLVIHQIDDSQKNMTYSDHMNFSDDSTLQYQESLNELTKLANAHPSSGWPLNSFLGTANGWKLTHNINKYLLKFFDSVLKEGEEYPFGDCSKPLTKNSKLICGPASGI